MTKPITLTQADMKTIRTALSYAVADRDSFLDAIHGCDPAEEKRTKDLIARFEKLSQKIFGVPTHYQQQADRDAATPTISIHELSKRPDTE